MNLKPNQQKAAALLAAGVSGTEVSNRLGVAKETVSRWQAQPAFRSHLDEMLVEIRETTKSALIGLSERAIDVIRSVLDDEKAPTRERLNAAFRILRLASEIKLAARAARECAVDDDLINRELNSWLELENSKTQQRSKA